MRGCSSEMLPLRTDKEEAGRGLKYGPPELGEAEWQAVVFEAESERVRAK